MLFVSLADSDYNTTAVLLTFEPHNDRSVQCADITIIDDTETERDEMFLVILSTTRFYGRSMRVQLDPQYAFITIKNNDIMTLCKYSD